MPGSRPAELTDVERAEASRVAFEQKQAVLKRYRRLGFEWGIFVGALIGVVAGGLQMKHWENPFTGWAITSLVLAGLGGALGYLFYDLVFGAQIRDALGAGGDIDFGGTFGGDAGGGADGGGGGGD